MRALLAVVFGLVFAGAVQAAPPQKVTIKEEKRAYTIDISYPRFGHGGIDRALEAWAQGIAKDFRQDAKEAVNEPNPWATEVTYEVLRNDASMIVVQFLNYSYSGGAHPNTASETFNFLLPEGRRVEFGEVFTARGVHRVSDIAIAKLKRDLGGPDGMADMDWIKRGAGPNARNFTSFALLPKSLKITFDAYQVAAYAAGPQEVVIPLSQLSDVMRANPRAPVASFECANAQSVVERTICSSNALATLDRHLGEAYAYKLTWEDDKAKQEALRVEQRAWLRARDTNCQGASATSCLTAMYEKRLKVLEQP